MGVRETTEVKQMAVAKLLSIGCSRDEIKNILNISKARISQLARKNPHIGNPRFKPDYVGNSDIILSKMDKLLGYKNLRYGINKYSPLAKRIEVDVVQDLEYGTRDSAIFSFETVCAIAKIIDRGSTIGVCGGPTIKPTWETRYGFEDILNGRREKPVTFIPLCGISHLEPEATRYSATMVCLQYHKFVNSEFERAKGPANLNCITNYSHIDKSNPKLGKRLIEEGVRRYLENNFPEYKKIYGDDPHNTQKGHIIDTVDTIITGIGTSKTKNYSYLDVKGDGNVSIRLDSKIVELKLKDLKKNSISGDIGGVFLPPLAKSQTTQEWNILQSLNSRLTTLNGKHLETCAKRADSSAKKWEKYRNGVVCVAFGEKKIEPILCAIKYGYINRLIIDTRLAKAIEKRFLGEFGDMEGLD